MAGKGNGGYYQQVVNKLRIDPPAKFTGSEDYDSFYKRFRNYISMTDRNYGKIFDYVTKNVKVVVTDEVHDEIDIGLSMEPGTSAQM